MSTPSDRSSEHGRTDRGDEPSAAVLEHLAARSPSATRYRIEGEVGHGGMGAVLRVWDEDLRRHLAMKVMLDVPPAIESDDRSASDPRLLARFLEEAQVTGQLDHPGIVPVHELGLDAEGRVYFTMKLVQGKTLADVLDELARGEGGWTRTRVLGLLLKVCEAMSYAHDKHVVHRDLKPANVMVGRFGEVYVMDWGLARVLDGAPSPPPDDAEPARGIGVSSVRHDGTPGPDGSPLRTRDGDVLGTPAYMSPEQARGRLDAVGPASDVYAVGAMLYHLLVGHAPPSALGLSTSAGGAPALDPPLRALAPRTSPELEAICERAMAASPDARYPDMSALAEDLSAYLEGRVVRAYETGAWAEARKWIRRNRTLAAALATAVLLLVLGLASSLVLKQQSDANAARADTKAQEALENLTLARSKEAEAVAQRDRAEAERAKVLRLSDLKRLQDLEAEAAGLWPPDPARIPALEDWKARATALAANLPLHRATLEEMRRGARSTVGPGESGSAFVLDSTEEQWQHDLLVQLVSGLEGLDADLLAPDATTAAHGWSVPKRLAFARRMEDGFASGGEYAQAWVEAEPGLRAAYPGLDLAPQVGLLPIGPDPDSGRWEFAHLMTGEPAYRGADGSLALTEETGLVLVLIPGGRFWMGAQRSDPEGQNYDPQADVDEGPVHAVELSPFFLSKYEMTQGQWERLTGNDPSAFQHGPLAPTLLHPVEQVRWLDCMTWLPRAGLRLPSEAQWEYAARAGTDTPWWTGADRESLRLRHAANVADQAAARMGAAWGDIRDWPELDDGYALHAPVGTFAANGFGLHEVTGNLWEWCLDGYDPVFYAADHGRDPVAPWQEAEARVVRGGSYGFAADQARSAARDADAPTGLDASLGVRPARAVTD